MNIFKAKSMRWTLHNDSRPEDKTRYIVISAEPIGVHDAISCLNHWAHSHPMYVSSAPEDVEIDYSALRTDKQNE